LYLWSWLFVGSLGTHFSLLLVCSRTCGADHPSYHCLCASGGSGCRVSWCLTGSHLLRGAHPLYLVRHLHTHAILRGTHHASLSLCGRVAGGAGCLGVGRVVCWLSGLSTPPHLHRYVTRTTPPPNTTPILSILSSGVFGWCCLCGVMVVQYCVCDLRLDLCVSSITSCR